MSICVNRTLGALAIALLLPLMFGACNKKASLHPCKNNHDCRIEAGGPGGVCVMGQCQECADSTDCTDLKQCVNHRCVSSCQTDVDCSEGHHCENNFCAADCTSDANCLGDKVCAGGRCMSQGMIDDPNALGDASGQCGGLGRVHFDFDRYDIKTDYHGVMEKIVQCLHTDAQLSLTIGGYTDDRGTPTYNMVLGERRAVAVKRYLESKGIASFRMKTVSYGEQNPLDTESTEHAWQQNRRAEFLVENSH